MPGIYFELRRLNTIPYSFLISQQQTDLQFEQAAEILAANPPDCVVLNYVTVEKFGHNKENPVDAFISDNYQAAGQWGNVQILRKRQ